MGTSGLEACLLVELLLFLPIIHGAPILEHGRLKQAQAWRVQLRKGEGRRLGCNYETDESLDPSGRETGVNTL